MYEQKLVDHAAGTRFEQFRQATQYWINQADAVVGDDGDEPDRRPGLTIGGGVGGEHSIRGHLDPVGGAEVATMIDRIADGCARTLRERRAQALVEMARRAAATPAAARRPRPLITVIVGDESFRNLCETGAGAVLRPCDLAPHRADSDIETILFDGPHVPVSTSPRRTFTGALRRAIQVRDRHCQHESGCDEPIDRCDVDHVVAWSDGGDTSLSNGRLACRYHNRIHPQRCTPPPPPEPPPDG
jgi:hypothetical protein